MDNDSKSIGFHNLVKKMKVPSAFSTDAGVNLVQKFKHANLSEAIRKGMKTREHNIDLKLLYDEKTCSDVLKAIGKGFRFSLDKGFMTKVPIDNVAYKGNPFLADFVFEYNGKVYATKLSSIYSAIAGKLFKNEKHAVLGREFTGLIFEGKSFREAKQHVNSSFVNHKVHIPDEPHGIPLWNYLKYPSFVKKIDDQLIKMTGKGFNGISRKTHWHLTVSAKENGSFEVKNANIMEIVENVALWMLGDKTAVHFAKRYLTGVRNLYDVMDPNHSNYLAVSEADIIRKKLVNEYLAEKTLPPKYDEIPKSQIASASVNKQEKPKEPVGTIKKEPQKIEETIDKGLIPAKLLKRKSTLISIHEQFKALGADLANEKTSFCTDDPNSLYARKVTITLGKEKYEISPRSLFERLAFKIIDRRAPTVGQAYFKAIVVDELGVTEARKAAKKHARKQVPEKKIKTNEVKIKQEGKKNVEKKETVPEAQEVAVKKKHKGPGINGSTILLKEDADFIIEKLEAKLTLELTSAQENRDWETVAKIAEDLKNLPTAKSKQLTALILKYL